MTIKKGKFDGAHAEWWMTCPYCGHNQEGEVPNIKAKCESCKKPFITPEEMGELTEI